MRYDGRVEVGFYDSNRVAIYYEGAGEMTQLWGPLVLYAAYGIRHLMNLGPSDRTAQELAIVLSATTPGSLTRDAGRNDDYVRLVDYPGTPGKKRFVAELHVEASGRPRFTLEAIGFGPLGRGLGYYSPSSVVLLQRHLSERFLLDDEFQEALADTSRVVAAMFREGALRPYAQEHAAVVAANIASRGRSRIRNFRVEGDRDGVRRTATGISHPEYGCHIVDYGDAPVECPFCDGTIAIGGLTGLRYEEVTCTRGKHTFTTLHLDWEDDKGRRFARLGLRPKTG